MVDKLSQSDSGTFSMAPTEVCLCTTTSRSLGLIKWMGKLSFPALIITGVKWTGWSTKFCVAYCEYNLEDLLLPLLLFMEASLRCDVLFAILEFRCIKCFAYALASLAFSIFLCFYTYPSAYCIPFLF